MSLPAAPAPPSSRLLLAHYWLPVAIGWSLAMVMQEGSGLPFSFAGMTLLLAGIGTAYSLDRYFPATRPELRRVLLVASLGCGFLTLVAALRLPAAILPGVVWLGGVSLVYPWLKRFPLGKTLVVTAAWLWAAATFPFGAAAPPLAERFPLEVVLPLVPLLATACILCDIQDREEDRHAHVPSLPALWGTRWTCGVGLLLALSGVAASVWAGKPGLVAAGLALAGVACCPRLLERKALGPLAVDATLLLPGVLILCRSGG